MDAVTLLREQAKMAADLFSRVLDPLTDEQALWKPEGGKTNPIAATVVHVAFGEDRVVQGQQGKPPLFESNGWAARIPLNPREPWAELPRVSAEALRAYVAEVAAATQSYLEGLRNEDVSREVTTPRGTRPLVNTLSLLLIVHKFTHIGEIAGLLGCLGVTGFPV